MMVCSRILRNLFPLALGLVLLAGICSCAETVGLTDTGVRIRTEGHGNHPASVPPVVLDGSQLENYRIHAGDFLTIRFMHNHDLNGDMTVRPDGKICFPLIGDVDAEGKTTTELRQAISRQFWEFQSETRYASKLKENDDIQIRFVYNPELNQALTIRGDGKISMPLIGDVAAAGLSPSELRRSLMDKYAMHLKKTDVAVLIGGRVNQRIHADAAFISIWVKAAEAKVFVGGEVTAPKSVGFDRPITTLQAIMQAGGIKETADLSKTVILRRIESEQNEQNEQNGPELRQWIQTDLSRPLSGKSLQNDVRLRNGDIVIVPMSGIAKVDLFVKQYIRDVLPLQSNFTVSVVPYDAGAVIK